MKRTYREAAWRIQKALDPENAGRKQGSIRTLDDMSDEEKAALANQYGVAVAPHQPLVTLQKDDLRLAAKHAGNPWEQAFIKECRRKVQSQRELSQKQMQVIARIAAREKRS